MTSTGELDSVLNPNLRGYGREHLLLKCLGRHCQPTHTHLESSRYSRSCDQNPYLGCSVPTARHTRRVSEHIFLYLAKLGAHAAPQETTYQTPIQLADSDQSPSIGAIMFLSILLVWGRRWKLRNRILECETVLGRPVGGDWIDMRVDYHKTGPFE